MQQRHIYTRTERRGKRLAVRDRERECVRETGVAENGVGVCCKNLENREK
jgi:hypothetical protein